MATFPGIADDMRGIDAAFPVVVKSRGLDATNVVLVSLRPLCLTAA
jgi:hypothetical protein